MGLYEFGSLHGYLDLGRSSVHTVFFTNRLVLPVELKGFRYSSLWVLFKQFLY